MFRSIPNRSVCQLEFLFKQIIFVTMNCINIPCRGNEVYFVGQTSFRAHKFSWPQIFLNYIYVSQVAATAYTSGNIIHILFEFLCDNTTDRVCYCTVLLCCIKSPWFWLESLVLKLLHIRYNNFMSLYTLYISFSENIHVW